MREVLLVTNGHPYEREPFYEVFDDLTDVNWTLVEQMDPNLRHESDRLPAMRG